MVGMGKTVRWYGWVVVVLEAFDVEGFLTPSSFSCSASRVFSPFPNGLGLSVLHRRQAKSSTSICLYFSSIIHYHHQQNQIFVIRTFTTPPILFYSIPLPMITKCFLYEDQRDIAFVSTSALSIFRRGWNSNIA